MIENLRQITRANGKNKLVEFNDNMQFNDFSDKGGVKKSRVHSKFSKIEVVMVDWSLGKKNKAVVISHNFNPSTIKAIANAIISGNMDLFTGKGRGFIQQKIDLYKPDANNNNLCPVSKISIRYEQQMNNPWTITLESGVGFADKSPTGGVQIRKGSYQKRNESKLALSIIDMIEKMTDVRDYINQFESYYMAPMLKTRNRLERKRIEEYKKNKANNVNQYDNIENIEQYAQDTSGYINSDEQCNNPQNEQYVNNPGNNLQHENNEQYGNNQQDGYNNYNNPGMENQNNGNNGYSAPVDENHCVCCGAQVDEDVKKFSNKGFGATVCRNCQTHCVDCGASIALKNALWSFKNKGMILCTNCQKNH